MNSQVLLLSRNRTGLAWRKSLGKPESWELRPLDLVKTSRDLARVSSGRPREANLRRAVSTAYYAMFHCLAECCANLLVGGSGSNRSQPAWNQTYRALDHGNARRRCESQNLIARFPIDIQDFANLFVDMQAKRHSADYDPDSSFSMPDVIQDIEEVEDTIIRFNSAPRKDRRAFAVYVLLRRR